MAHHEHATPRVLSASTITGDAVVNGRGEDLGKIEELMIDLETGQRRQLTNLNRFAINSFDVSPDGKHIVFDRLRNNADIVMFELER